MSYDLVVFDSSVAPRERAAFKEWFAKQVDWDDSHDYSDPSNASETIRCWYDAIRNDYPAMNGPDAVDDDDLIDRAGDYNFGHGMIYVTYPWSLAEEIYTTARRLAVECKVGFYDVSADEGDGEIYFPGDALRPPLNGAWRDIARQFSQFQNNPLGSETE